MADSLFEAAGGNSVGSKGPSTVQGAMSAAGSIGSAFISANGTKDSNAVTTTGPSHSTGVILGKQTVNGVDPSVVSMLAELLMKNTYSKQAAVEDTNAVIDSVLSSGASLAPTMVGVNNAMSGGRGATNAELDNRMQSQLDLQGAPVKLGAIQGYTSNLTSIINALITGSPQTAEGAKNTASVTSGTQQQVQTTNSSSMCFITTAVCRSFGKDDSCEELTLLRSFRDTFMLQSDIGKQLVEQYYQEAPAIVAVISTLPDEDAAHVYDTFDQCFIQPAIEAIKEGDSIKAAFIYIELFDCAKLIAQKLVNN